jgi:selenocysteine lyase/cysteine desulfurase
MSFSRKEFLKVLGGSMILSGLPSVGFGRNERSSTLETVDFSAAGAPNDEIFWNNIAKEYYSVSPDFINLENGFFGIQPKPVLEAYAKYVNQVNEAGALYARREFPNEAAAIQQKLADFLQVSPAELLLVRNATEALNIAIQGYPFQSGDEVIVNQLDYYSMIETFQMLENRGQLTVKTFEMPLIPASPEEIIEIYRKQITAKTRVILLTQVSNITGLIIPVKEITAMAKAKGIDTITDSAHALGQIPFDIRDMDSDFVGMNLHKWIGNPVGAGLLYVKKDRIKELKSLFGDKRPQDDSIARLGHVGTTPFAIQLSIPDALKFHEMLGINRIAERMNYLKSIWVDQVKALPNVEVLTPSDSKLSCGIASFRIKRKNGKEVENELLDQHKIFTVARILGEEGCIRVTPGIYTKASDMEKLAEGIRAIAG